MTTVACGARAACLTASIRSKAAGGVTASSKRCRDSPASIALNALNSSRSGSLPGRNAGKTRKFSLSRAMRGRTPAFSSEDLPEPDPPTTAKILAPPCTRLALRRSMARRTSSSRPKKIAASAASNDISPG